MPIFVSYYRKSDKTYIFDKPVKFSELCANGESDAEIADKLRLRCNELGKMNFEQQKKSRKVS